MPDFLKALSANGGVVDPISIATRLFVALVLGVVVAWVYARSRGSAILGQSFPTTLVLLAVLIAMVTQVIGDNIARAFSLVGALSIVRFRTVVRDTKDTAFVIFAVVVGMAVGGQNVWVAAIGIAVVAGAAFAMSRRSPSPAACHVLTLRIALGLDAGLILNPTFDRHVDSRELMSVSTTKTGGAFDYVYETRLKSGASAEDLVKELHLIEGVQDVRLQRRSHETE